MRFVTLNLSKVLGAQFTASGDEITEAEDIQDLLDIVLSLTQENTTDSFTAIDAILLDLTGKDQGISFLPRLIRAKKIGFPIIGFTKNRVPDERANFLEQGGDDLLTAPVSMRELRATLSHIKRLTSRSDQLDIRYFIDGRLKINLFAHTVSFDHEPIHFTGQEMGLLEALVQRPGIAFTKEMLLNALYNGMDEPEIKIIDVFICKVRKKLNIAAHSNMLGNGLINTVWGKGYKFDSTFKLTENTSNVA